VQILLIGLACAFGALTILSAPVAGLQAREQVRCAAPGQWIVPGRGKVAGEEILADAARQSVVLLGETHDAADHHRWQLQAVAALAALRPRIALGFEAFPRRIQPVLDRWVAGELSEQEFLKAAHWSEVWGYDAAYYLPLFHFARLNRIPMLALNVEHSLPREIGARGLESVPLERREGVSAPAPAAPGYLDELYETWTEHLNKGRKASRSDPEFQRFVQAQQMWDRAMAQVISDRLKREPDLLVVGIMGSGHIADGYGVPHQLRDLQLQQIAWLLPWSASEDCSKLGPGYATALFTLPEAQERPRGPLLGVSIETAPGGVRISAVSAKSIAEVTGLKAGDVVVEAAGAPLKQAGDLRTIVQSMAPGTWLPLRVLREAQTLEFIARFPRESRPD
jgi:uncharacterized iron-regulated protein